jgi:hypothetical protein
VTYVTSLGIAPGGRLRYLSKATDRRGWAMQSDQSTTARHEAPDGAPSSRSVSPIKAFSFLLAVLAVAGTILLLTRPDDPSAGFQLDESANEDAPTSEPGQENVAERLTNAEAIATFKRLDRRRLAAYRHLDVSLVAQTWTSDSPVKAAVLREIRQLKRDSVMSKTRFLTKRLRVISNSKREIRLRQTVVVRPKFVTVAGRNVTGERSAHQETIRWVLHPRNGRWYLYRSIVVGARRLTRLER